MNNNKLLITSIALFMCIAFITEAKGPQDLITGTYENSQSNKYDNKYPYGILELLKVSKDKARFVLSCDIGQPSLNQGDAEGVATLDNDRAIFKDGDCEITFIFKEKIVEVKVDNPRGCMGFGNNVSCSGIYKLKSRKLETLKQDTD